MVDSGEGRGCPHHPLFPIFHDFCCCRLGPPGPFFSSSQVKATTLLDGDRDDDGAMLWEDAFVFFRSATD